MSDNNKEENSHWGTKIENMLEEFTKCDDDLENNPLRSSLKFSDDNSFSDEEKENIGRLFDKDDIFNIFPPIEEQKQKKKYNSNPNLEFVNINIQNNMNQPNPIQFNKINNNFNNYYYNPLFSPNINYMNPNNNSFIYSQHPFNMMNNNNNISMNSNFIPNFNFNKNINNNKNYFQRKNSESINSLSTNYDKSAKPSDNMSFISIDNSINGNSFMNYQNLDNSFYRENFMHKFQRSKKGHNSFFAGDKIIFNPNIINPNNFQKTRENKNVEIEILLIEINKILIKIEKISQNCYNKLKGKFEQIIRTHKGSRIFQNYLKNTQIDILHQIFLEIKNKLPELLKDNYANYFCKKFFICLSQKDRIEYLTIIQNDIGVLGIDITATYPIQGIIEKLGSSAEKNIIYLGVKDYINVFCYNTYGTHVLEKMLSYFEDQFVQEIIDFVYDNFMDLACHINGICVVKKLILMMHKRELHEKVKKIIYENTLNLIVHQYGNYVIQVIMENWEDSELEDIINLCKDKYVYLSNQKFSSNAVERIIEKNNKNLEYYINEICTDDNLSQVIRNNYGNYVIQKAVKLSSGKSQEKLVKKIIKNLHKLEDKKIINKWKMIISMTNF